jgi:hypothetical protein
LLNKTQKKKQITKETKAKDKPKIAETTKNYQTKEDRRETT